MDWPNFAIFSGKFPMGNLPPMNRLNRSITPVLTLRQHRLPCRYELLPLGQPLARGLITYAAAPLDAVLGKRISGSDFVHLGKKGEFAHRQQNSGTEFELPTREHHSDYRFCRTTYSQAPNQNSISIARQSF